MQKLLLFLVIFSFSSYTQAQLNTTLRSIVTFTADLNDIWGWTHAGTGKEYALVGRKDGVSIIEVTDPDNPVDVGFVSGANSTWRDIKTWGDYAYVTNETGNGVAVIYLGNLPSGGSVTSTNWALDLTSSGLSQLNTCHNIYIDENGYAYLAGCNLNSGGMLIVDVFTTPGSPSFVSAAPAVYSHDVYVRDNRMYSSEIYVGIFTIYDVTNKNSITTLGSQPTPFDFTHNAWISDDGNYIFTTDEKANAPIGSYDISDPTDIQEVDQFIPLATEGQGVIPHNTHVLNDYIIASYYTDGGVIIDASEPHNLIEVGNYDTYTGAGAGFNGTWGAFPFFPSGTILLTDIDNGLYVVSPTYVRACRIEGTVTDVNTGLAIAGANVQIDAVQVNKGTSDSTGDYKTGIATAGTYNVTYSAPGYASQTFSIVLINGTTVMQDVQLGTALPTELISFTAKKIDEEILVEWQTSTEIGNAGFELERSENNIDWEKIAFIEGQEASFEKQNYSFLDKNPLENINYYRLRQIDEDGSFEYSKVVKAGVFDRTFDVISISPNPVLSEVQINLITQKEGQMELQIFDIMGRLVFENKYSVESGENTAFVPMSELVSGVYFMEFKSGEEVLSFKIVKE